MKEAVILAIVVLALGCMDSRQCEDQYVAFQGGCCLDKNRNGICDDKEGQSIVLIVNASGIKQGNRTSTSREVSVTSTSVTLSYAVTETPLESQEETQPVEVNATLPEESNSTFCSKTVISLTSADQDGYIRDNSVPPDDIGDEVWLDGYLMVGDLGGQGGDLTDPQYRSILAFPIPSGLGNFSDAKLNVLPYLTQGTSTDILLEHILCSGSVSPADYGSSSDGAPVVIVKSNDADGTVYGVDVTSQLQTDVAAGRTYSCYRLTTNQTQFPGLKNGAVDRRILYGQGGKSGPYLEFTKRPCIRCRVNDDCKGEGDAGVYKCIDGSRIVEQFTRYRCTDPGAYYSRCIGTQDSITVAKCRQDETCINGENTCFPKICHGGLAEGAYSVVNDAVCGVDCRPCHCFNGAKDEAESEVDCGRECRPCPPGAKLSSVLITYPTRGRTYITNNVRLGYVADRYDVKCFFSLNYGGNISVDGDRNISAREGANVLQLYCNDPGGNTVGDRIEFTVESNKTICPSDTSPFEARYNFDSVVFDERKSSANKPMDSCNDQLFNAISTLNDSTNNHPWLYDLTRDMGDRSYNANKYGILYYRCASGVSYALSSIHLSGGNISAKSPGLSAYVYFRERSAPASNEGDEVAPIESQPINTSGFRNQLIAAYLNKTRSNKTGLDDTIERNSFWRIYQYNEDGVSVDKGRYIDMPYDPVTSSCQEEPTVKYQRLNITSMVHTDEQNGSWVDARVVLYSRNRQASLDILEIEYSTE